MFSAHCLRLCWKFAKSLMCMLEQLTDRVKMHFNESLCPQAYSEGLAMNSKSPYAFGVDPTWKGTRTELQFLNSVKMKISILLGARLLEQLGLYIHQLILWLRSDRQLSWLADSDPVAACVHFLGGCGLFIHALHQDSVVLGLSPCAALPGTS